MFKKFAALAVAMAVAGPAFAGAQERAADTARVAPVMERPARAAHDWTGPYAGVQGGFLGGDARDSADSDGSGPFLGAHLGYSLDMGGFVIGAELDADFMDVGLGAGAFSDGEADLESIARLKLRAGVPVRDRTLVYGTAGGAHARTSDQGKDEGWLVGGGIEQVLSNDFSVSGEVLYQRFDDFDGSGVDLEATTLSVRGSFRF